MREVHDMFGLADGGPDVPGNVAALCLNYHLAVHYAIAIVQAKEAAIGAAD